MCLSNKSKPLYPLFLLVVILIAIALRAPDLTRRPVHTDEAVHAIKFGMLLEDGFYRYDNTEYHGPTLNYFTLVPAWLGAAQRMAEIDEATLRVVPVVFGIALVPLLLLLVPGLGRGAVLAAGFLTAASPAMVFYSRYYIQEMLLVFFTFAALVCGYRYLTNPRGGWAVAVGISLGLMHATKETAVIAAASVIVALSLTVLIRGRRSEAPRDGAQESPQGRRARALRHGLIATAVALGTSALFYSSFFSNPAGIIDSYSTYATYFTRAGQHEWHIHPWYYYITTLLYSRGASGPVWTEASIVVLAGFAVVLAATRQRVPGVDVDVLRFFSTYAVTSLIIYSAIPYKTPWNMLSTLHGLIILAGVGAVAAASLASRRSARVAVAVVLVVCGVHLATQSYLASRVHYADTGNPYVYAHPTDDVIRIAERVQALADAHPDGNNMYIEVIGPEHDYWPLPWYLRSFPNTGWWSEVDADAPAAPVIIAPPSVESAILAKLYEVPPPGERPLYVPMFGSYTELRPTVEIRGYVVKDLWDRYQQDQPPEPEGLE